MKSSQELTKFKQNLIHQVMNNLIEEDDVVMYCIECCRCIIVYNTSKNFGSCPYCGHTLYDMDYIVIELKEGENGIPDHVYDPASYFLDQTLYKEVYDKYYKFHKSIEKIIKK